MKKKLSKVLAVVLSLAMVLGLAAVDTTAVGQAAKKLKFTKTGKKAVKSGQKRTLKISGTKAKKAKWTVTGTGKQYIKLAKKKGKTNSFTVKANAIGKAKVTAKLTKKNKVSFTYTLSCDIEGIAFDAASATANVDTGATVKLNLAGTPTNAVVPSATYAVWMDAEKKVAADATKVTCAAFEGGVEFGATAEGTYYVVATAGDMEATAVVTVKNRVAVLKEAKQTKLNELVLTFDSDCSYIGKDADVFNIVNSDNVRINVSEIKYDDKDKTIATLTTLQNMDNGGEVTVDYAGNSVKFTASNGEVSKIELSETAIPVNTKVELKAIYTDANGVQIKELKLGDRSDEKFEIQAEGTGEATVDDANHVISMKNLTDTVKGTAYYRSGKFDANNEQIIVEQAFEIKAVAEAKMSAVKGYSITDSRDDDEFKYTDLKEDKKDIHYIKVMISSYQKKELFAHVFDDLGYEKVNGSFTAAGYKLSSADDTILQVDGDLLQGNREGKTYVVVSNEDGKVLLTIPVEVKAAPQLKTFKVDKSSIVLSAGNKALPSERATAAGDWSEWKSDEGSVKVTAYDQYDEKFTEVNVTVGTAASSVDSNRSLYNDWNDYFVEDTDDKSFSGTVRVNGRLDATEDFNAKDAGTYDCLKAGKSYTNYYTITVEDNNFHNKVEKTVGVTTKQPNYSAVNKIKLEAPATIDTTLSKSVNKAADNDGTIKDIKVALYAGDVFVAYDFITKDRANVTITKDGKTYKAGTFGTKDDYVIAQEKLSPNFATQAALTLGAIYMETPSAITTGANHNKYDVMSFAYRTHKNVSACSKTFDASNIRLVQKADATRYTIKVTKIKFAGSETAKYVTQSAFITGTSLVTFTNAVGDSLSTTISVTDKQAVPTITQLKKTMSDVTATTVIQEAFRVECSDTDQDRHAAYDPKKIEDNSPDLSQQGYYAFRTVDKGFKQNDTGVSFTKIDVLVPYPSKETTGYQFVSNEVFAPFAVKVE